MIVKKKKKNHLNNRNKIHFSICGIIKIFQIKNNKNPKLISKNQSHWKCTRLCDFAKNNWPGTDKNICQHVHEIVQEDGIDEAINQCTKEGFSLGYYSAPG